MGHTIINPRTSLKVFEGLQMNLIPTFIYVFKPQCQWCDEMRSEWRTFTKISTSFCNTLEVNCDAISRLLRKYPNDASKLFSKVNVYPFLELHMPNGKLHRYTGNRDASSLKRFVMSKMRV